jgi:NAD(P)-dependent dehydrogenase (short-subunit alcohol dehydrogenase family)
VNASSTLGRFALPGSGVYPASTFALEAASDALRIELAPFGAQVVLVEPGVIDTPLYQRAAALPGDEEALAPYRSVCRRGSGSPSGCCGQPLAWTATPRPWPKPPSRPARERDTGLGCAIA